MLLPPLYYTSSRLCTKTGPQASPCLATATTVATVAACFVHLPLPISLSSSLSLSHHPPPLRSLARAPHERGTNTLAHMHALAGDDGRCVGEGEREGEFERTGGQRVVTGGFDMDLVVQPFPPT